MKNSDSLILSIDAGGTSLKAGLILNEELVKDSFMSLPIDSAGSKTSISETFCRLGEAASRKAREAGLGIRAAAVCIPGPFDYKKGCSLMTHKYKNIYGLPLGPFICKGMGREIPVKFMHDSTAFLLGSVTRQNLAHHSRVCGVIIGTGLGFASMIDGKILESSSGGPGISIFSRPYLQKTAEDYVSKRGIIQQFHASSVLLSDKKDVKDIADAARGGDTAAADVFAQTGVHLGKILRPILEEWHFTLLILGGAISKSSDLFLPGLRNELADLPAEIVSCPNIDTAPLLGAARNL